VLVMPNPDSGGRTALRGRSRPRDARSVSSRIPRAFSRGQVIRVGLTSIGLRHHQHNRAPGYGFTRVACRRCCYQFRIGGARISARLPRLGKLVTNSRRVREISIQRLAICRTPAQELWPRGNTRERVAPFRKKPPECRVVPAQLVPGAVAMRADAGAQPFYFGDERFTAQVDQVPRPLCRPSCVPGCRFKRKAEA
jgi:hypothetical protein